MANCRVCVRDRTVLFLTAPALWPVWPFLPVVRRRPGRAEELGVVFDARAAGRAGYGTTVYLTNLFFLPPDLSAFLALSHETFDTAEDLTRAGWRVD